MRFIPALLSFFLGTVNLLAVEIVAHRGASYDAPENTLAAFRLGYQQGADGVELDIHLTADNRVVIMHDFDTKRVGGVTNKIATQKLADLRKFEVGRWGKWTNANFHEKIPTLQQALELVPAGKKLFIEIKTGPEIIPAVEKIMASKQDPARHVFITFNYESAKAAKKTFPRLKTYWLVSEKDKTTGKAPLISDIIAKAKEAKVDGVDLNFNLLPDKATVDQIKAAGLECHVWTVDDPEKAQALAAAGVDSITTNRPQYIREQLKRN